MIHGANMHHTEGSLITLIVWELMIGGILAAFLAARGWTIRDIGLSFDAVDAIIGLGLALLAYVAYVFAFDAFAMIAPASARAAASYVLVTKGTITLATVVAVAIINPLYEELFVTGYVMTALRDRGWAAFHVSLAIRLSYHLYQGPI